MAPTEIEAIQSVDSALSGLDPAARSRVLKWAWEKFSTEAASPAQNAANKPSGKKKQHASAKPKNKASAAKLRPSIVKDLNLVPKGKKDFRAFVAEKKPDDNYEKCTVAVYYLVQELAIKTVGIDHVFTCYKFVNWRQPSSFQNALALTAHRKGWLDTSDIKDIKLTAHGENLIEHDLPRQGEKEK